jgi:hypothetical protein
MSHGLSAKPVGIAGPDADIRFQARRVVRNRAQVEGQALRLQRLGIVAHIHQELGQIIGEIEIVGMSQKRLSNKELTNPNDPQKW